RGWRWGAGGGRETGPQDTGTRAAVTGDPDERMDVIVAMDDELGPDGCKGALKGDGVDQALMACRWQRRMMNHDDTKQVLCSQIVQHLGNTRDLLVADLAGSHQRWRRDCGRDADQRHRPAPAQIRKRAD